MKWPLWIALVLLAAEEADALQAPELCYVLDGILFVYGIVLTFLYCRLKPIATTSSLQRVHDDSMKFITRDRSSAETEFKLQKTPQKQVDFQTASGVNLNRKWTKPTKIRYRKKLKYLSANTDQKAEGIYTGLVACETETYTTLELPKLNPQEEAPKQESLVG